MTGEAYIVCNTLKRLNSKWLVCGLFKTHIEGEFGSSDFNLKFAR
jgi:hypothetical protein